MTALLLVAVFGLDFNVCDVRPTFSVVRESCYFVGCQCVDCSGAECRCGVEKVRKSHLLPETENMVRVCGPNGCQMVPRDSQWTTTSSLTGSVDQECLSGSCGSRSSINSASLYVGRYSDGSACSGGSCGVSRRGLFGRRR